MRLELSLSSRSVTIGTAALAYLHDAAACRLGGEKKTLATVGERRERERERGGEKHIAKGWREGEREEQSVHGCIVRYEWHASLAWVVAP